MQQLYYRLWERTSGAEVTLGGRIREVGMGMGWHWRLIFLVSLGSSGCSLGAEAREGIPWESPVSSLGFIPFPSREHFGLWLLWWLLNRHTAWFWELQESPQTLSHMSLSQFLKKPFFFPQVKFTFSEIHRSSTYLSFKLGFDKYIYRDTKAQSRYRTFSSQKVPSCHLSAQNHSCLGLSIRAHCS